MMTGTRGGVGRAALLLLAAAMLAGCASMLEPRQWERVVGVIDPGGMQMPPFQAPDTVRAGTQFQVHVTTYGSSTCTRADGAELRRLSGTVAEITPYDRQPLSGICTSDLVPFPRAVGVRFDEAGVALIRIVGRSFEGTAEFEKRVVVRP
jgi:hypothetical protein